MFTGKAGVVVGATAGIGRATALAFGRLGANVIVSGRRASEGHAVVEEIRRAGGTAEFVAVDVADEASIAALIAESVRLFGRLDFAVNNAARELPGGLLHERTAQECDDILAVNVRGVFLGMKYQLIQMLSQGSGAIVNVASTSGHKAFPYAALYTATKHAVVGLTKAAAAEYVKQGIRINAISPGVVDTETMQRYCAGWRAWPGPRPSAAPPIPTRSPRPSPGCVRRQAPMWWGTACWPMAACASDGAGLRHFAPRGAIFGLPLVPLSAYALAHKGRPGCP